MTQQKAPEPAVRLRAATPDDDAFVVEMTRHACIAEDRPLPDPDDDEVLEMFPRPGVVPIIAEDQSGVPVPGGGEVTSLAARRRLSAVTFCAALGDSTDPMTATDEDAWTSTPQSLGEWA
jgi:hypothetical protein